MKVNRIRDIFANKEKENTHVTACPFPYLDEKYEKFGKKI